MVLGESLDRAEVGRGVYRVEIGEEAGERIFTVVGPSGARLYSYASPERAKGEAESLNAAHASPLANRAARARIRRGRKPARRGA